MKWGGFGGSGWVLGFVEQEAVGFGVVGEDFGVAAPVQGGVDLALRVFLGEVFIQNVAKEFQRHGAVRLSLKSLLDLLNQGDVAQDGLAKELFSGGDVGFGEFFSRWSDLDVSLSGSCEAEHDRFVDDGEEIVDFHEQLFGQVVEVFFAATIVEELEQSGHPAGGGVGQQLP